MSEYVRKSRYHRSCCDFWRPVAGSSKVGGDPIRRLGRGEDESFGRHSAVASFCYLGVWLTGCSKPYTFTLACNADPQCESSKIPEVLQGSIKRFHQRSDSRLTRHLSRRYSAVDQELLGLGMKHEQKRTRDISRLAARLGHGVRN